MPTSGRKARGATVVAGAGVMNTSGAATPPGLGTAGAQRSEPAIPRPSLDCALAPRLSVLSLGFCCGMARSDAPSSVRLGAISLSLSPSPDGGLATG